MIPAQAAYGTAAATDNVCPCCGHPLANHPVAYFLSRIDEQDALIVRAPRTPRNWRLDVLGLWRAYRRPVRYFALYEAGDAGASAEMPRSAS